MPFISEEIWQRVAPLAGRAGTTIMHSAYPECEQAVVDPQATADIDWLKAVVMCVRNIRGEMNIAPGRALPLLFSNGSAEDQRRLQQNRELLAKLAKLESIEWLEAGQQAPQSATQLVGAMEVLVPMAGLIDKDAESTRLHKEIDKLNKDLQRIRAKLDNPSFVAKAPAAVVDKEKAKLESQQQAVAKLQQQLASIQKL